MSKTNKPYRKVVIFVTIISTLKLLIGSALLWNMLVDKHIHESLGIKIYLCTEFILLPCFMIFTASNLKRDAQWAFKALMLWSMFAVLGGSLIDGFVLWMLVSSDNTPPERTPRFGFATPSMSDKATLADKT